MADLATLKLRHDALRSQRSSGVARVSYDGKSVDYRSVAEIDRAIEALEREIALAEGRRMVRQVRITTALFAHSKQNSIHAKKKKPLIHAKKKKPLPQCCRYFRRKRRSNSDHRA